MGRGSWVSGTHLQNSGQCQFRERNGMGLAVQVLQGEVVQLLQQAVLCSTGGGRGRGAQTTSIQPNLSAQLALQGGDLEAVTP